MSPTSYRTAPPRVRWGASYRLAGSPCQPLRQGCREHPKCPPHEQLVMSAFTGLPVERAGDRSRETGGPRGESHDEDGSDRDDGEGGADGVPGGGHSRALSPAAAAPPEAVRDLWRRRPDGRPFRAFAQEAGLGDDHRRALPTQTRGLPGLLAAPLS